MIILGIFALMLILYVEINDLLTGQTITRGFIYLPGLGQIAAMLRIAFSKQNSNATRALSAIGALRPILSNSGLRSLECQRSYS